MFYVGQKVCCVNDDVHAEFTQTSDVATPELDGLTAGVSYTVRRVGLCPIWNTPVLWVVEITRPLWVGMEAGYHPLRFRPVVERKTSIEVFRAMLNPSKQGADA